MKQGTGSPAGDLAGILRARAQALARREAPAATGSFLELLEFRMAQDRYAIETRHVSGVLLLGALTPVPCTPAFVAGVLNVRGRVTVVIDIHKFFGLPARGIIDLHHVILVRGLGREIGLLADAVVGVGVLAQHELLPAPPSSTGTPAGHVMGVTSGRVLVLDVARMLSDPRMLVNEEVNP